MERYGTCNRQHVTDMMLHVAAIVTGIRIRWSLLRATCHIRSEESW